MSNSSDPSERSEYSYKDDDLSAESQSGILQMEKEYDTSCEESTEVEEEEEEEDIPDKPPLNVTAESSVSDDIFTLQKPFDLESGSYMSFIQGEGPINITPAAGKYVWNVNLPGFIYRSNKERGERQIDEAILLKRVSELCCNLKFKVKFAKKLQFNSIQRFEDEFRIKATSTAAITLQDIKDVVIYTALIDIPPLFIRFFHTVSVDKFLRSLIIYMQYTIQISRAMKRRRIERETKLWHPNTMRKYQEWKNNLDLLRFILGRNYYFLITGRPKDIRPFKNKSFPACSDHKKDKMLFELLYVFSQRVVEIALYEKSNLIIIGEMQRLFRPEGCVEIEYLKEMTTEQRAVIESKFYSARVVTRAPVVRELGRPARKLPFVVELEQFLMLGDEPIELYKVQSQIYRLLQLVYFLSETKYTKANIRVGILGFKRENFNPTLTDQTSQVKFDEAQIPLETGLTFTDDPASKYPEPVYIIPKMNKKRQYYLNVPFETPIPADDRCKFWIKHSKLKFRIISDFIISMAD